MSESNIHSVPPVAVVDAFRSALVTALQELVQLVVFSRQTAEATEQSATDEFVLAAIQLLRPLPGNMSLVLTAGTAAQLAARYLPRSTPLSAELIDDVAGEFANVIAGQAKTILKGTPYHFTLTTPAVTRAASLAALPQIADYGYTIPLASEIGQVLMLIDLPPCPNA